MDRLMSRDQVKSWILANEKVFGTEYAINFARQLYDIMGKLSDTIRENEQLKEIIRQKDEIIDMCDAALSPKKELDNG